MWDEVYERARELYGEQGKEIAEHQLKSFGYMDLKNVIHMIVAGRATTTCIMYNVIIKADFIITGWTDKRIRSMEERKSRRTI